MSLTDVSLSKILIMRRTLFCWHSSANTEIQPTSETSHTSYQDHGQCPKKILTKFVKWKFLPSEPMLPSTDRTQMPKWSCSLRTRWSGSMFEHEVSSNAPYWYMSRIATIRSITVASVATHRLRLHTVKWDSGDARLSGFLTYNSYLQDRNTTYSWWV
jgi:hypothetical protein